MPLAVDVEGVDGDVDADVESSPRVVNIASGYCAASPPRMLGIEMDPINFLILERGSVPVFCCPPTLD